MSLRSYRHPDITRWRWMTSAHLLIWRRAGIRNCFSVFRSRKAPLNVVRWVSQLPLGSIPMGRFGFRDDPRDAVPILPNGDDGAFDVPFFAVHHDHRAVSFFPSTQVLEEAKEIISEHPVVRNRRSRKRRGGFGSHAGRLAADGLKRNGRNGKSFPRVTRRGIGTA